MKTCLPLYRLPLCTTTTHQEIRNKEDTTVQQVSCKLFITPISKTFLMSVIQCVCSTENV